VTLPARLHSVLSKNEDVLWQGKPDVPRKLSAYGGWSNWVARFFFAISALMTLLFWTNRGEVSTGGLTWGIIGFVGGPIVIGLACRFGFAWLARDAMESVYYAVTNKRILVQTKTQPMSFTITKDTPAEIVTGRKDQDVLRFTQAGQFRYVDENDIHRSVYTAPKGMILPRKDAVEALEAINSVKARK